MRCNSWCISFRSLQNNNVTWQNFALSGQREPRQLIFGISFQLKRSLCSGFSFCNSFESDQERKRFKNVARFVGKIEIHFLINLVLGVAFVVSCNGSKSTLARHADSYAQTLTCFLIFPTDFCRKETARSLATTKNLSFSKYCLNPARHKSWLISWDFVFSNNR